MENAKREIMEDERGTHMDIDGEQQSVSRNINPHSQEMDQTYQISATLGTNNDGGYHQKRSSDYKLLQVTSHTRETETSTYHKFTLSFKTHRQMQ